ncbi:MAG: tetratricopeptide repeat protein [Cyanobacteria bacterium J06649_11]
MENITEISRAAAELSRAGKPLQALTIYEQALEKFPDNLEVLNHLAIT